MCALNIIPLSFCLPSNDVTGNLATQAYTVRDKRIIVLSQLGKFALFITSAKGH